MAARKRDVDLDAARRAADRAEARARGEPVEYAPPATLDPKLTPPTEPEAKPVAIRWDDPLHPKGVEYHPSGRPVVRYGPPPKYPKGVAEDALCAKVIEHGAQGYTFHAIALKIGYPPTTLTQWASQPYGAKLRDAIAVADAYARGAIEGEARENLGNGKWNTALFGKLMASRYADYRPASGGGELADIIEGNALPEDVQQQEFERRLMSAMQRMKQARDANGTPPAALPPPTTEEGEER